MDILQGNEFREKIPQFLAFQTESYSSFLNEDIKLYLNVNDRFHICYYYYN